MLLVTLKITLSDRNKRMVMGIERHIPANLNLWGGERENRLHTHRGV
jgi:hypothetical protein